MCRVCPEGEWVLLLRGCGETFFNEGKKRRMKASQETGVRAVVSVSEMFGRIIEVCRERRITPNQMACLSVLERGPLLMTGISEALRQTTAAATGMIDKLEQMRLVERYRTAEDRRVVWVKMTERGGAVLDELRRRLAGEAVPALAEV